MDLIEALDATDKQLSQVASTIEQDQWASDTPCDGWTVRNLVDHVASGCAASAVAARGAKRDEVEAVRAADHLGDDAVEGLRSCLHAEIQAFEAADRDQSVEYFEFPANVEFHLNMRLSEVLIHTWDLAKAIGADDTLNPQVVEIVLNHFSSIGRDALRGSGKFGDGPAESVASDLDRQQQLLALAGRSI